MPATTQISAEAGDAVSNPPAALAGDLVGRPCFCGHPQSDHTGLVPGTFVPCRQCWLTEWPDGDWCSRYIGVPRKEPLRAHVAVSWRQLANLLADYVDVHVYGEAGPSIKDCLSCQGLIRMIERKRAHEVQS